MNYEYFLPFQPRNLFVYRLGILALSNPRVSNSALNIVALKY